MDYEFEYYDYDSLKTEEEELVEAGEINGFDGKYYY